MVSQVGGGSADFSGRSTTVEIDPPQATVGAVRLGITGEFGVTESGKPVVGAELGAGIGGMGLAAYKTETTITSSVTFFSAKDKIGLCVYGEEGC